MSGIPGWLCDQSSICSRHQCPGAPSITQLRMAWRLGAGTSEALRLAGHTFRIFQLPAWVTSMRCFLRPSASSSPVAGGAPASAAPKTPRAALPDPVGNSGKLRRNSSTVASTAGTWISLASATAASCDSSGTLLGTGFGDSFAGGFRPALRILASEGADDPCTTRGSLLGRSDARFQEYATVSSRYIAARSSLIITSTPAMTPTLGPAADGLDEVPLRCAEELPPPPPLLRGATRLYPAPLLAISRTVPGELGGRAETNRGIAPTNSVPTRLSISPSSASSLGPDETVPRDADPRPDVDADDAEAALAESRFPGTGGLPAVARGFWPPASDFDAFADSLLPRVRDATAAASAFAASSDREGRTPLGAPP
mmetsp:Transcript_59033/g.157873  ORF Transcript_59033/g.157873 Transcript_59033/m.157873 type:complete len:370 (-) Transcript_59033:418-1527(-)